MPGVEYLPFLRFVRGWQPSTAITSASKAWNIAGLKCALLVAGSNDVRKALHERVRSAITEIRDRIGHLGAIGNVAAFRHGGPWLDAALAHLDGNRRLFAALIEAQIPQIRYRMPEASYLAWLDCTDLGLGPDPAEHFLTHGRVALEPGHKFGKPGENYVRVNMGTSSNILREIVDRMAAALNG
jgi:cystathionine beta-lyase